MHQDSQYQIRNSSWAIGLIVCCLLFFCPIEGSKAKASTSHQSSLSDNTALLKEGFAYKRKQQWKKTYEAFSKVLQEDEKSFPALIGRGEASLRLNKFGEGLRDANAAIQIQANSPFGYILRAMILTDMGQYQKALDDTNQAIAIDPQNAMLFRGRASLYINLENPPQALKDLDYAFSLGDRTSKFFQLKAMALTGLTFYQEALKSYSTSLEINSENMDSLLGRGAIYNCLGEFSNAIADMTRLLVQDPTHVKAHIERGRAFLGLQNSTAALSDITAALEESNKDNTDYLTLGQMYFKLNKITKALEMTQKSIEINPEITLPDAYIQKGYFLLHSKSFTEAKAAYAKGINHIQNHNFNYAILISTIDAIRNLEELLEPSDPQDTVSDLLQQLKDVLVSFPPYQNIPNNQCVK